MTDDETALKLMADLRASLDPNREARAWATARNIPADVMSEAEFLGIPGLAEHTEAAVRRIAHNSIVVLALREAFEDVFNHPDHPNAVNVAALPELRRAWRAWKDTL